MRIRYELTVDDMVAFHLYQRTRSPMGRRAMVRQRWLRAVEILFVFCLAAVCLYRPEIAFGGLAAALVWIFLQPYEARWQIVRAARRFCKNNKKKLDGPHEMELLDHEFMKRDSISEFRTRLTQIDHVVIDGDRAFIYLDAMSAHVIPRRLADGDFGLFLETLERRRAELHDHDSLARRVDDRGIS
jgi:hypothetical protein